MFNTSQLMCQLWTLWSYPIQRYAQLSTQMQNCWCPPSCGPGPCAGCEPGCEPEPLEWICVPTTDFVGSEMAMFSTPREPELQLYSTEIVLTRHKFERVGNVMVLSVTVDLARTPRGVYQGQIIDKTTKEWCGELTLTFDKKEATPASFSERSQP